MRGTDVAPAGVARGFVAAAVRWPIVRCAELFELRYGRALVAARRRPGGIRVFGSNGPCGWHDTALFAGPGVILGRKGQGPLGVAWCDGDHWVIDTAYSLGVRSPAVDLRFAYYLLRHVGLDHLKDGTSNPSLGRDSFAAQAFPLPPLADQRRIAAALDALDRKIALARRMNQTLEAMARTVFERWFVGPALPAGWRRTRLDEIVACPRRVVTPGALAPDTPYIGLEHLPRRAIALGDWGTAAEVTSHKLRFARGEILFGKLRPYFHKVGIAPIDGVCSTDILVLTVHPVSYAPFALFHAASDALIRHVDAAATGTRMPRASWSDIAGFEIALPPAALAARFAQRVQPLLDRITTNLHEARTLAALRDLLVPRLLSGELDLPSAARRRRPGSTAGADRRWRRRAR